MAWVGLARGCGVCAVPFTRAHLLTHSRIFSHSLIHSLIRLHWVLGAGSVLQEYFAAPPDVTTVTPTWICQGLTQSQTLRAPFRAGSLLSCSEASLWVRPLVSTRSPVQGPPD